MKKCHKKGVFEDLGNLLATLGYIAILCAIIFLIIAQAKNQVITIDPCMNSTFVYNTTSRLCQMPDQAGVGGAFSASYNATDRVQIAMVDIPTWLPIVVITVIGGILLTLVRFFKQQ